MSIRYAHRSILVVGHMVLGILQIVFHSQKWNIVHTKDQKINDHIANVWLFVIWTPRDPPTHTHTHVRTHILLAIESRAIDNSWAHIPILFKYMSCRVSILRSNLTINQSNMIQRIDMSMYNIYHAWHHSCWPQHYGCWPWPNVLDHMVLDIHRIVFHVMP